jgi:hypothetical protein
VVCSLTPSKNKEHAMRYLRKLILLGLVVLASAASAGTVPAATPPSVPGGGPGQTHVFRVYYRQGPNAPWKFYASFEREQDAREATALLRGAGYGAFYN